MPHLCIYRTLKGISVWVALCGTIAFGSCHRKPDPAPSANSGNRSYNPTPYVITVPSYLLKYTIPADNPMTQEGIVLGRLLFYEKQLSLDNTISCGSCHKQSFAFADDKALSLGVGNRNGRRSTMSIANSLYLSTNLFWDGRASSLEDQIHFPIQDTLEMRETMSDIVLKLQSSKVYPDKFYQAFGTTTITSALIAKAISQFERTLISTNSRYDQARQGAYTMTSSELNGMNLFQTHPQANLNIRGGNCADCHSGALQGDNQFRNNGLDNIFTDIGRFDATKNENDKGKFRVPSLRNIVLTAPYMHDGRFKTLEEVLDHYNEHIKYNATLDPLITGASNDLQGSSLGLTQDEKNDIIIFLHTLTDSSFIQNPMLASPY